MVPSKWCHPSGASKWCIRDSSRVPNFSVLFGRVGSEQCSHVHEHVLDVGRWKRCSEMNTLSNNLSNTRSIMSTCSCWKVNTSSRAPRAVRATRQRFQQKVKSREALRASRGAREPVFMFQHEQVLCWKLRWKGCWKA